MFSKVISELPELPVAMDVSTIPSLPETEDTSNANNEASTEVKQLSKCDDVDACEHIPIFFNESAFVRAFQNAVRTTQGNVLQSVHLDKALVTLRTLSVFKIPVISKEANKRVFRCPLCPQQFNDHLAEVKLHILEEHLKCKLELAFLAVRYTTQDEPMETENFNDDAGENKDPLTEAISKAPKRRGGVIYIDRDGKPYSECIRSASEPVEGGTSDDVRVFYPKPGTHNLQLSFSVGALREVLKEHQASSCPSLFIICKSMILIQCAFVL